MCRPPCFYHPVVDFERANDLVHQIGRLGYDSNGSDQGLGPTSTAMIIRVNVEMPEFAASFLGVQKLKNLYDSRTQKLGKESKKCCQKSHGFKR
jgi:hypothetical protein